MPSAGVHPAVVRSRMLMTLSTTNFGPSSRVPGTGAPEASEASTYRMAGELGDWPPYLLT